MPKEKVINESNRPQDESLEPAQSVVSTNSSSGSSEAAMPKMKEIAEHVGRIQRRQFGYAFGGPNKRWCESPPKDNGSPQDGIELTENPLDPNSKRKQFRGCLKYAKCELVPAQARWTTWGQLSEGDKQTLITNRCYRATRDRWNPVTESLAESERSGWDPETLQSRKNKGEDAEWISNPFGVRTVGLGEIARQARGKGISLNRHRDFSPCPLGGCVTPEMERDYHWDKRNAKSGSDLNTVEPKDNSEEFSLDGRGEQSFWATAKVCPFFHRHVNTDLTEAAPNPERFTQCYVTLPEFRSVLSRLGVIVAAPVFRSSNRIGAPGEAFWYPLYSGFSYLQFPTRAPSEQGWTDPTLPLRWHATAGARQHQERVLRRELPVLKLFESIETGEHLTASERRTRVVTFAEGSSTAFLLQWILIRRLKAALEKQSGSYLDISSELEWLYEKSDEERYEGIINKLVNLGYDIERQMRITIREEKAQDEDGYEYTSYSATRRSSLEDDLKLLGLLESGRATERVKFATAWLEVRRERATGSLDTFGKTWTQWIGKAKSYIPDSFDNLASDEQKVNYLCWLLLCSASRGLITPPIKLEDATELKLDKILINDKDKLLENLNVFEKGIYKEICHLIPLVHVLIRANWTSPVRWVFLPTGIEMKTDQSDIDEHNRVAVRVHSGIIALLEDNFQDRAYQLNLEDKDSEVWKQLQLARAPLFTVARIEAQHVRGELIAAKEWWDSQHAASMGFNHNISTIEKVLNEIDLDSIQFVADMLNHLKTRLYVPPSPASPIKMKPKAAVDLVEIAETSIERLESFFKLRRQFKSAQNLDIKIRLESEGGSLFGAIQPMEDIYEDEANDQEKLRQLAQKGMLVFLNDLLLQRITAKEKDIILRLNSFEDVDDESLVTVQVEVPNIFRDREVGRSKQKSIGYWKEGRGFYSTFFMANSLGAVGWEVGNLPDGVTGFIRVDFRRWTNEINLHR